MKSLLTAKDVACRLNIDIKKVQRLARTGVLPCIKVGAVYRFRQEVLEDWIEVSERKSTQAGPVVGVPVQGFPGDTETEDPNLQGIPHFRISESGRTELAFRSKRPSDSSGRVDCYGERKSRSRQDRDNAAIHTRDQRRSEGGRR